MRAHLRCHGRTPAQWLGLIISMSVLALVTGAGATAAASPRPAATTTPAGQVRSVYRTVLTAEYFGPVSGVCSHLTAAGVTAFTALAGVSTCTQAFDRVQHGLRHKTPGVDDSGYTPTQWRTEVNQVMAHLKVSVTGTRATAIGPSGIPGRTTLVKTGGTWCFSTYPPSVQS